MGRDLTTQFSIRLPLILLVRHCSLGEAWPQEQMAFTGAPTLPFSRAEHLERVARLRARLRQQGFDAMLVFAQESHYWLTGYDTGGFVFFQCAVLTADDTPITLLTRRPDLLQVCTTSTIEDVRLWWDAEDADPTRELLAILEEKGLNGARIAVELNTHGLTGWNLWRLQKRLSGWCTLESDDNLIRKLRLIKSPAEIAIMRNAAALLDQSLLAVIEAARPGVMDSALNATYLRTVLEGGGDMPPNAPLFNSGARAVYGRGVSAPRRLEKVDQVVVEYPVAYRRYCVKTEWTILLGQATDQQRRMYDAARSTLHRMTEMARPGRRWARSSTRMRTGWTAPGFSGTASVRPVTRSAPPSRRPRWTCRR